MNEEITVTDHRYASKISKITKQILAQDKKNGVVKMTIESEGTFRTICCNVRKEWSAVWDDINNDLAKLGFELKIDTEFKKGSARVIKATLEEK